MGFLWATDETDDPKYANGQRISLTTLEPSFTWRVIDNPNIDVVDYGVGAGLYWMSSEAFPSVRGSFLEPVRLDFHAATNWAPQNSKRRWLGIPVFRFGLMVFPAGHETAALGAKPGTERRISRDWVRNYGIFADLDPLIRWLKDRNP